MIRVAIVEDHPAIADGLAALMAGSPGVNVVGTARDLRSANALIEHESPDIACATSAWPILATASTSSSGTVPIRPSSS